MIERKQVKGISTDYKAYMGEDNPSDLLSQGTVLAEHTLTRVNKER